MENEADGRRDHRRRATWLRTAGLASAALTAAIGAAVLAGWCLRNDVLMDVLPGHVSMKANTAVCFLLAGLAVTSLFAGERIRTMAVRATGGIVLTIGALTLFEYLTDRSLSIDTLLFQDPVQHLHPGRMAYVSTIEFCLTGAALLLLTGTRRSRRAAEALAATVTCIAYAAVVGYAYGVPILYGAKGYNSMALHTGLGFLLLGAAMMLVSRDAMLTRLLAAEERGSWMARRLFPALLVLPPSLGVIFLLPAISLSKPAFGVALFSVSMVLAGVVTLVLATLSLNQQERRLAELNDLREASSAMARQSERELLLITDQLPTLLSYIDMEGRYVRVNRTYEAWLGIPANQLVGRTAREVLGEPYFSSTMPALEAVRRGESATFDADFPTVRGDRRAQITYAPDVDERGQVRGFAVLVLDIHDRFRAEQALRQSEKLAAVGRLASSIAHEMNNPLEAVTNLLYLAAMEGTGPEETREFLDQAQTELSRVTHIVTQTLRFHRQASHPVRCFVSSLATQVLALYQGRLSQKHIFVEERFRDKQPVLCLDGEVRQVLANLVGNAVDAMGEGGRLILRTRNLSRSEGSPRGVIITVADVGHGIDAAMQARLFEPFHTSKGATGSGLGLWISREIVERHHGRISVRSSQRQGARGTVFRVLLREVNAGTKPPEVTSAERVPVFADEAIA